MTYFPFVKLFIEILEEILSEFFFNISLNKNKDKIKFKRLEDYTIHKTEENEILKKIDLSIIKDVFLILICFIVNFLDFKYKRNTRFFGSNFENSIAKIR